MMKPNILIALPILAAVACGLQKNEKSIPADQPTTVVSQTVEIGRTSPSNVEVPALGQSLPTVKVTPTANPSLPTPSTSGLDKGEIGGNGKGETGQNKPDDQGKGETGQNKPDDPGKGNPEPNKPDDKDQPTDCEIRVLDFETKPDSTAFATGEKVKEQYRAYGVRFKAYRRKAADQSFDSLSAGEAITFNSAAQPDEATRQKFLDMSRQFGNDDGFDDDLITSQLKNVLIIAEHTYDSNSRDDVNLVTYPDDNSYGGKIKLYFDKPTRVLDMDFVAVAGNQSKIELWSGPTEDNLVSIHSQTIPQSGANAVNKLNVGNSSFVSKLKILVNGSGAVDNIRICVKK